MKNNIKLYNVLFPFWMLIYLSPIFLSISIVGNFIIDSIVLLIAAKALKNEEIGRFYKSHISKVYICGFTADFVGAVIMTGILFLGVGSMGDELFLTVPGLLISAVLIYFLNYMVSFKDCEKRKRKLYSLIFAIVTAPYTFLIPSSLLYN